MGVELQIPEVLVAAAQRTAASLGMSLGELYTRALLAFLRSSKDVVRTERGHTTGSHPVWAEGWAARGL